MSEIIISVENLSKSYLIGHRAAQREQYVALRDEIAREARNFTRKAVDLFRGRQIVQGDEVEEFWALQNVNFQIKRGEILGIVGRNGAGKSTLLKILSRITPPTQGRVLLYGRVASLLEVGTGFHRELTGRENIFLNGAILGMTQREIRKKFDEIVAFAQVEKFVDTPVKQFSSGMYVRLAFAVAAHLEPEILIIDEVLAVGDAEFQSKCLGKIDEISRREGRTVLLVSHNLASVAALTHRALLLDSGVVLADGATQEVISAYISKQGNATVYVRPPNLRTDTPHISRAAVITSDKTGIHQFGAPLEVHLSVNHQRPMLKSCLAIQLINQFQQCVVYAWAYYPEVKFGAKEGESLLVCRFPSLRLNVGNYYLRVYLNEPPQGEIYEKLDGICQFEVIRIDKINLWGWNPDDCSYHEDWNWTVDSLDAVKE
jgi:homopolymeric O-antigen transport system ATP-binding protein